jgi:hypothetical protein
MGDGRTGEARLGSRLGGFLGAGRVEGIGPDAARTRLAAAVFAAGLVADLATKAFLPGTTYYGFGIGALAPRPLWLIAPAVVSLLLPSRPLTIAAGLMLAGVVGNTLSQAGPLDFGAAGSWNLADLFIADGLLTMSLLLTWRLWMLAQRMKALPGVAGGDGGGGAR